MRLDDAQRICKERRVSMFPALGYACLFSVQTELLYAVVLFFFVYKKFTTQPAKVCFNHPMDIMVVRICVKDPFCRI